MKISKRLIRFTVLLLLINAGSDLKSAQVLFYVDGVTAGNPTRAGDIVIRDRLLTLGHNITTVLDSAGTVSDTAGKNLVLISSSIQSGDMATVASSSFRTLGLPMIVYESALYDELLMGASGSNPTGQVSLTLAPSSHPLAAGMSGTIAAYSPPGTMSVGSSPASTLGNDAQIIATVSGGQAAIFAYEQGNRLSDNATLAASRRVGFYFNEPGVPNTTAAGFQLFDAAVNFALVPEPGALILLTGGLAAAIAIRSARRRRD